MGIKDDGVEVELQGELSPFHVVVKAPQTLAYSLCRGHSSETDGTLLWSNFHFESHVLLQNKIIPWFARTGFITSPIVLSSEAWPIHHLIHFCLLAMQGSVRVSAGCNHKSLLLSWMYAVLLRLSAFLVASILARQSTQQWISTEVHTFRVFVAVVSANNSSVVSTVDLCYRRGGHLKAYGLFTH